MPRLRQELRQTFQNSKRNLKIKRQSHILTKKSAKRKRNLRRATMTDATNIKNMKKLLPYL